MVFPHLGEGEISPSPLITLIILFGLELGVALIQTYVYIILTCTYIQDGH